MKNTRMSYTRMVYVVRIPGRTFMRYTRGSLSYCIAGAHANGYPHVEVEAVELAAVHGQMFGRTLGKRAYDAQEV